MLAQRHSAQVLSLFPVFFGGAKNIKELSARCARINIKAAATEAGASVDGGGATPLHTAARYFRAEFARNCCNTLSELIALRPLALEEKDKKGRLPLHVLARYHGAQVRILFF